MESPPQPLGSVRAGSVLLTSLSIGPWTLAHRVVVAPVSRRWADQTDGSATPEMIAFYGECASPGGLIVAEAVAVAASGLAQPGTAGMFAPCHANSWRPLVDRVHSRGGIILAQLWHAGRLARAGQTGQLPIGASAVAARPPTFAPDEDRSPPDVPEAMTEESIETVIDQYRQAAEHAADAGFDGVELHAADGCLVDQYLHESSNLRDDPYGGQVEQRTRFLTETVQALASVWGAERVGVRLSPLGPLNDVSDERPRLLYAHVARTLRDEGVAYLHIMDTATRVGVRPDARLAREVTPSCRDEFARVLLASGGYAARSAEEAVTAGLADAVALG